MFRLIVIIAQPIFMLFEKKISLHLTILPGLLRAVGTVSLPSSLNESTYGIAQLAERHFLLSTLLHCSSGIVGIPSKVMKFNSNWECY